MRCGGGGASRWGGAAPQRVLGGYRAATLELRSSNAEIRRYGIEVPRRRGFALQSSANIISRACVASRSYRALPGSASRKSAEIPGRAPAAQQLKKLELMQSRLHRTRRQASSRASERAPAANWSESFFSSQIQGTIPPQSEAVTRVFTRSNVGVRLSIVRRVRISHERLRGQS